MTSLDSLKQSNIWDDRYNLPTSPQNNNPWVYMALSSIVCPDSINHDSLYSYWRACRNLDSTLNRWPKSPSEISQDEMIGASYLIKAEASVIWNFLKNKYGFYSNTGSKTLGSWYGRFPWFMAYIKYIGTGNLGFIGQMAWNSLLVTDILKTGSDTNDASGRILIWIMGQDMQHIPICGRIYSRWKEKMMSLGITPKKMLILEPKENPVLSQLAPEKW